MSWCRWSTDDYSCDLYVYESESGVEVCVAGSRYTFDRSVLPPTVPLKASTVRQFVKRNVEVHKLISAAGTERINLPHAGETLTFTDLGEAADFMDKLAALGYCVPEGLTDEMREEANPTPAAPSGATEETA